MAEVTETSKKYRYPGTNFFEENQEGIFFGREKETTELMHAIKAHEVYVIFANSGIGKTSLLNARLIPKLRDEAFLPIRFRFQDISITPLTEVKSKLTDYILLNKNISERRLWDVYKSAKFKNKVVLIFDQFEEFFNHPKLERDKFTNELADLISDYLPDYIMDEMRKKFKVADPSEEELQYYSPINVRSLFLIRADKLNLLDDLSKEIPLILRNRFQLKPLDVDQAKEAILNPAKLPQNGFFTPPLHFEKVCSQICNYLKNDEGEVESFQLQILCNELEKKMIGDYKQEPTEAALTITEEKLGGDNGMSNIVQNYYKNQIDSIQDPNLRSKAVLLIEEELIIEKRRISLPENFLIKKGYPIELLRNLVDNTRLIRGDRIRKEMYYEISHDKLLPPILTSRQLRVDENEEKRRIKELEDRLKRQKEEEEERAKELKRQKEEEEERAKELKRQKEEEQKLKEEEIKKNQQLTNLNIQLTGLKSDLEKKAKKLQYSIMGMALLLLFTVALLIYANNERINNKINNVNGWIEKQEYQNAKELLSYNSSKTGIRKWFNYFYIDTFNALNNKINTNIILQAKFDSLTTLGNSFRTILSNNLYKAYSFYKKAEKLNYTPVNADKKINWNQLNIEIKNAFDRYVDKAEAFFNAKEGVSTVDSLLVIADSLLITDVIDKKNDPHFQKLVQLKANNIK